MPALACLPVHTTTTQLSQQPSSLLAIQPPPRRRSSTNRTIPTTKPANRTNPSHFHSLSNQNWTSSSASYLRTSGETQFPANDSSTVHSESQLFYSNLLAVWLQSCSGINDIKRVHAVVLKCLNGSATYVYNNLISAYLKEGDLEEARNVFDKMAERNVVTWTAMINGYLNFGFDDEGLRLFRDSVENGVVGNSKTFVCVLNLCSRRMDFGLGRQVHACIVKGNWRNLIVDSALVNFYARCEDLKSAFCVFDRMEERDVVCWTTMITACSQQGRGEQVFEIFSRMLRQGFSPNEFTACSVLNACGEEKALKLGRQLHGAVVKKIFKNDIFIGTSLVDMYAKCGEIVDSRKAFNQMRSRNTVTWTSIIAGYARMGLGEEALRLFRIMKRRKVISNTLTVVSILRACGSIRALLTGREVHAQIVKNCIESNEYIQSTLVWFYCKCLESRAALKVFQQIPRRNVVSWTALISGYACLGHESEALEFLKQMLEEGVEPNSFTYSSSLKACANLEAVPQGRLIHSFANKTPALSNVFVGSALIHMYAKCGYVSEANQVFESMPERNLISWKSMIMGYARNGLWREALKLIYRMRAEGIEVDDYVFATVLGACGDIELDEDSSSECYLQIH